MSIVTRIPAGSSEDAVAYFEQHLAHETDCWDVHHALAKDPDFVLLDVRSETAFGAAHIPGAINLPYQRIDDESLDAFPPDTLFVVYCNGPHCNAGHRAAARLAALGRPVKEMIGGVLGWRYSNFELEESGQEITQTGLGVGVCA